MSQWRICRFPYAPAEYGAPTILQKVLNRASSVPVEKLTFWGRWRASTTITQLQIYGHVQNMHSAAPVKRLGFVYQETVPDEATFGDVYVKERSLHRVPCGERRSACQS